MEITLEKVDTVIDRTGVSYLEAKRALEESNGDVLAAIIYIEENFIEEESEKEKSQTIEEFKSWIKGIIEKGDVTRIKIKKEDKELLDIPVNAGIAATVIAVMIPQIMAFGVIVAVASKITIEITKQDGTVEVVNKYITSAADTIKDKANGAMNKVKKMFKNTSKKEKVYTGTDTVYSYTVKFDEDENN